MASDPLSLIGDLLDDLTGGVLFIIVLSLFILLIIFVQFERVARWIGLAPPKSTQQSRSAGGR